MKNLYLYLVIAISVGCSTAPINNLSDSKPICNNKNPNQTYIWSISFNQVVPNGMEISKVSEFVKNRSDLQDRVSNNFVKSILFKSANAKNSLESIKAFDTNLDQGFIETDSHNYIYCVEGDCTGLKDPLNNKVVSRKGDPDFLDGNLRFMYYVEGIIDPNDSQFRKHRLSQQYGGEGNSFLDWDEYFNRNPFPGGNFLTENYFVIPDSTKKDFCIRAGYIEDCFATPKFDFHNDYIIPVTCSESKTVCEDYFRINSPFRYEFLLKHSALCANSCIDPLNELLAKFKSDPFLKRDWEDAITKDIFLKLSVSQSRKVEKKWIITRIEWNPTLFCKYANPITDLYTH